MILLPIINTLNDILYPIIYMCVLKKYLLINLILVNFAFLLAIIMQNHEHKGAYTGGEKKKAKKK